MPIASIITPGTLSIRSAMLNQSSTLPVPFLNFTNLCFTDRLLTGENGFEYNGPSQIVQTIAAAVSAQGTILSYHPAVTKFKLAPRILRPILEMYEFGWCLSQANSG